MSRSSPLIVFAVFAGLLVAGVTWLQNRLLPALERQEQAMTSLAERLSRIEEAVALIRFDRDPKGQPLQAILEHLDYWSGQLDRHGASLLEKPALDRNLGQAQAALRALGQPATAAVEAAFESSARTAGKVEFRKCLIRVLADLDRARCATLCEAQLRTPGVDPQIRSIAGQILVDLDSRRASVALREVLLSESYQGGRRVLPLPGADAQLPEGVRFQGYPGFHYLVTLYLMTPDESKSDVLLRVLTTDGHDLPTLQEAIRGLEERRSQEAVPTLVRMFENPSSVTYSNPLLRRRLAQAVAAIQGEAACPWLRERFKRESNDTVQNVLAGLLKEHCGLQK